jgi:hypothetical protein
MEKKKDKLVLITVEGLLSLAQTETSILSGKSNKISYALK